MHMYDDTHESPPAGVDETCRCDDPVPEVRGDQKGMGRTYCERCGQPVRLAWR